jgi:hypothetical protein
MVKKAHQITEKLTLSWLRENLALTIGRELVKKGFSIDKKNTKLQKKIGDKNLIEIYFDCYGYSTKLEFRLMINFKISEIDMEAEKFDIYRKVNYQKGWTFMFVEGNFNPKTRDLEPKYITSATHIVYNKATLEEAIADCRKVLKDEIIPMFPNFSDLLNFQNLIENNFNLVTKMGLMRPALIATKLKNNEEIYKLVDFLWKELDMDNKDELHATKILLKDMIKYVKEGN